MVLHPAWGWIGTVMGLLAVGYALVVRRLNDHARYGAFWRSHAWVEVVVGCLAIAGSAGLLFGWQAMAGLIVLDGVWGTPMILGELWAHARAEAERDEQRIADQG